MIYRQSLSKNALAAGRSSIDGWSKIKFFWGGKLMNNPQFQYETQYLKIDHLMNDFGIKKIINEYQLFD